MRCFLCRYYSPASRDIQGGGPTQPHSWTRRLFCQFMSSILNTHIIITLGGGLRAPLAAASAPLRAERTGVPGGYPRADARGYGLTPARPPPPSLSSATPRRSCKAIKSQKNTPMPNAPQRRRQQADATPRRCCKDNTFPKVTKNPREACSRGLCCLRPSRSIYSKRISSISINCSPRPFVLTASVSWISKPIIPMLVFKRLVFPTNVVSTSIDTSSQAVP